VSQLDKFIDYLEFVKNYSFHTINNYQKDIEAFESFLKKNKIKLLQIDKDIIRKYLYYLNQEKKLAPKSISRAISSNRSYWRFLKTEKKVKDNPWQKIANPKIPKRILDVANYEEVVSFLDAIKPESPLSKRDRAIFEMIYATGMRVGELISLNMADLDLSQNEILVYGKGSKERIVIIGRVAQEFLEDYIVESRGKLIHNKKTKALFLNNMGQRITARSIERNMKKYLQRAGTKKILTPHSLRHAFASHLLENGADMRSVQELLGHVSLSTTQIYTHLNKEQIKKAFSQFHPRA